MRRLTSTELRRAADRAIDRVLCQVLADDRDMNARRRLRLGALLRCELDQVEQNFFDNGQGVVRFDVDVLFNGVDRLPCLRVSCEQQP